MDLETVKDEISTFNKGMKTVGTPYWLSRPEVRAVKAARSFVIAFKTEQEAA